ncbi:MAG: site-specific integrase [Methylotenera sp.]|uniref:tyrosine-type recombinase/integrase n=1 Tax=Methylotenera sp. TaxID=2051956 RepID=UPI00184F3460|nr:site-specific integrase [Methylotenera sp.]NOU24502.1 site-specific integrase [Methylotenera sp.]
MATFRKRGDKYHVQVRLKGQEPATASFERLSDAKEWAAKAETEIRAGKYFGQSKRRTFDDLVEEYRPHAKDVKRLEYWQSIFGSYRLADITPERINRQIKTLESEDTTRYSTLPTGNAENDAKRTRAKRTGATVNRYIAALSSCFSYGVKPLQWIERNPCERVTKPKEGDGRVRFLSDDERPRLLDACRGHGDLYLAVVLSLTTGARQGEIMTLRYGQIDFNRKVITLNKTKNGDKRALALVGEAFELLQARSKVRSLTDDRVFPPTAKAKKAECLDLRLPWEVALKAAGIKDFHWHDLRHTAASYLAMSGVSLVEIAKVLGHRTLAMVARYAHLSDEHIVATGEKLAARLGV